MKIGKHVDKAKENICKVRSFQKQMGEIIDSLNMNARLMTQTEQKKLASLTEKFRTLLLRTEQLEDSLNNEEYDRMQMLFPIWEYANKDYLDALQELRGEVKCV